MPPSTITVEVDTREQCPFLFPATVQVYLGWTPKIVHVKTTRVKLPFGDYRLKHAKNACVIERKGCVSELSTNLLDARDSVRQAAAFKKLCDGCLNPVVWVEARLRDFLTPTKYVRRPQKVLECLMKAAKQYNFQLVFAHRTPSEASRRTSGELAIHMMLAYADGLGA